MPGRDGDADAAAAERLVLRPMAVLSGRVPMEEASRLLAPDLVSYMDGCTVRGRTPEHL